MAVAASKPPTKPPYQPGAVQSLNDARHELQRVGQVLAATFMKFRGTVNTDADVGQLAPPLEFGEAVVSLSSGDLFLCVNVASARRYCKLTGTVVTL